MPHTLHIRPATPADLGAVDALLARSYPRLLAADYPPSVMVTAVPLLARANPGLLASGRYFLAEGCDGAVLAAGGWSPTGRASGQVRHVVTDHRHARRGIGRALMARVLADARGAGAARLDCLATRTAVPFYADLGFAALGPVDITLRPGIVFPAERMQRRL